MPKKKPLSIEEAMDALHAIATEAAKSLAPWQTPKQRKYTQEVLDVTHDYILNNIHN